MLVNLTRSSRRILLSPRQSEGNRQYGSARSLQAKCLAVSTDITSGGGWGNEIYRGRQGWCPGCHFIRRSGSQWQPVTHNGVAPLCTHMWWAGRPKRFYGPIRLAQSLGHTEGHRVALVRTFQTWVFIYSDESLYQCR